MSPVSMNGSRVVYEALKTCGVRLVSQRSVTRPNGNAPALAESLPPSCRKLWAVMVGLAAQDIDCAACLIALLGI